jgi:hypothetical protein
MSMLFNAAFYLRDNPDVLLAVTQKIIASAEAHFNEYGAAEGRNPNAFFDTTEYLLNNPDVLKAGVNPLTHFLEFGAAEGRSPSPSFVTSAQFDTVAYAAANPDLATAKITTPAALYEHFAKFGFSETRPGVQTTNGVAITDGVAGGAVGTTFTLTTGVDQGAAFTGTSSNDTFIGVVDGTTTSNTVGAADVLDGGKGKDTLAITVADDGSAGATANLTAISTSNIETISVRSVDATPSVLTVNGNNFVGATEFVNDRSTAGLDFDNIGKADVTVKGNGSITNGATNIEVGGTTAVTDAFILNIKDGVKGGAISVNDTNADWTIATVNSTGAANTVGAVNLSGNGAGNAATHTIKTLNVNAATNLTTGQLTGFAADSSVVISGAAAKVVLGLGNVAANVDSIDASGLTAGGVTVTLDNEADTKFVGGKGSDVVTAGNVAYIAANTASINAGDGADTLVVDNALALGTAASGAKFTGFEALEVKTNGAIDLDFIAGITSIVVDNAGGVVLKDVSTTQAGAITVQQSGALDIAVKGAATVGQVDTVKITADDGVAATSTIALGKPTLANVEKLELVAVDNLTVTDLTNATSLTGVTASGAGTIGITTGAVAFAINTSINASAATGAVTIDAGLANTNGLAITGSATGVNILTGSSLADVIVGGAGKDVINGGAGADTLTGGANADTFAFSAIAATTAPRLNDKIIQASVDAEVITLTADTTDNANETLTFAVTLNGVTTNVIADLSGILTTDKGAVAAVVDAAIEGVTGATTATVSGGGSTITVVPTTPGSLTIAAGVAGGITDGLAGTVADGIDRAQISFVNIEAGTGIAVGDTFSFTTTLAEGTVINTSYTATTTVADDVEAGLISAFNIASAGTVTASDGGASMVALFDQEDDNGGFTVGALSVVQANAAGNATSVSVAGTVVSGYDKITDYAAGSDILQFVAADNVAGAALNAVVATSTVQIDGNGKVTFAAADDTLAEKVTAIAADNTNVANNETVFFEDGGNTYVYMAGTATNNDTFDQLVELTGVVGLAKITESTTTAGDFSIA